jgi:molybdenum cofactor biosynthesis protein B
MTKNTTAEHESVAVAILTVSDSRDETTDTSGHYLVKSVEQAGHSLADKKIVIDDVYQIRAIVSQWIADASVNVILVTGGTGFTSRDSTPEAVSVLFDKTIDGYGELFRYLSYEEIGTSTVQSRAVAGLANETIIFCMPGSTGACKTAWSKIISEQLESTHRPCNFVGVLKTRAKQL